MENNEKEITISAKQLNTVEKALKYVYKAIMLTLGIVCTVCLCQMNSHVKNIDTLVDAIGYQEYLFLTNGSLSTNTSGNTSGSTDTTVTDSSTTETDDVQQYAEELFAMDYFKEHTLNVKSFDELKNLEKGKKYYVYFYMSNCSYCAYTDFYLIQYINQKVYESSDFGNIYFVNVESQDYNWAWSGQNPINGKVSNVDLSTVGIAGTPTMLSFNADGTIDGASGVNYVLDMVGIHLSETE